MRISKHKYGKPYHRKLHLKDGIWTWRYAGGKISIRSPDGKSTISTDPYEASGISIKEWMRKGYEDRQDQRPSIDTPRYPPFGPKNLIDIVLRAKKHEKESN